MMEMDEGRKPSVRSGRCITVIQVWVIVSVVFGGVCIILSAIILSRQGPCSDGGTEETNSRSVLVPEAVKMFPGFFRTPDEQAEYLGRFTTAERIRANISELPENVSTCSIGSECRVNIPWTPIRLKEAYHGCCHSWGEFVSPDKVTSVTGEVETLVQFNGWKQHFFKEQCSQLPDCNTCCVFPQLLQSVELRRAQMANTHLYGSYWILVANA